MRRDLGRGTVESGNDVDDRSRPQKYNLVGSVCPDDHVGVAIEVHVDAASKGIPKRLKRLCQRKVSCINAL